MGDGGGQDCRRVYTTQVGVFHDGGVAGQHDNGVCKWDHRAGDVSVAGQVAAHGDEEQRDGGCRDCEKLALGDGAVRVIQKSVFDISLVVIQDGRTYASPKSATILGR